MPQPGVAVLHVRHIDDETRSDATHYVRFVQFEEEVLLIVVVCPSTAFKTSADNEIECGLNPVGGVVCAENYFLFLFLISIVVLYMCCYFRSLFSFCVDVLLETPFS